MNAAALRWHNATMAADACRRVYLRQLVHTPGARAAYAALDRADTRALDAAQDYMVVSGRPLPVGTPPWMRHFVVGQG